jgi:2-C-methyl-D-erythritol 2,4-cyclodiphosphate synthase
MKLPFRIGTGIDVHPFADGRKLFLGGVEIPHTRGLDGHSDADVVLHALCDALLGSLALGDIGKHFPNTDPRYKDIDSKELLGAVQQMISERGYNLGNADIMILAEQPKILPYIPQMQKVISAVLQVDSTHISIKATTMERLGSIGREEGIAVFASVLVVETETE